MPSTDFDIIWERGLIDVADLVALRQSTDIKILDGTWAVSIPSTDFAQGVISDAQLFDLGHLKSISDFKSAYPPRDGLAAMLEGLNISASDQVVIYDRQGYFSAPRVWWILKTLGHQKVAVLKNGFPAWLESKQAVQTGHSKSEGKSDYVSGDSLVQGAALNDVLEAIDSDIQIVDARSADRFYGRVPEPRAGLRSGHIRSSLSLPLTSLKDEKGRLLEAEGLLSVIKQAKIDLNRPIITTCGSGVTTSALALIFRSVGKRDVSVYSGSWTEYGATEHPIGQA